MPTGVQGLLIPPIHHVHLLEVPMVGHAIEQGDDPIWIQVEGGCFLPEPAGAALVSLHKLGFDQLAGEQKHQLALLQCGKAEGVSAEPLGVPSHGWRLLHRSSSWGGCVGSQCAQPRVCPQAWPGALA
jgi:hypothetical protein